MARRRARYTPTPPPASSVHAAPQTVKLQGRNGTPFLEADAEIRPLIETTSIPYLPISRTRNSPNSYQRFRFLAAPEAVATHEISTGALRHSLCSVASPEESSATLHPSYATAPSSRGFESPLWALSFSDCSPSGCRAISRRPRWSQKHMVQPLSAVSKERQRGGWCRYFFGAIFRSTQERFLYLDNG